MSKEKKSDNGSDIYWSKFLNRLERAVGWFFFVTGIIILVSYILYEFVLFLFRDTSLSIFIKAGIFLIIGLVILVVSIVREKIVLSKKDKYLEVKE